MAKRRRTRFVPELVFGTLCVATVIPACSSGSSTQKGKDGGAGTGGIQGVAAGGFGGASVFAGGFGGGGVGAGGFGGATVAAGGFGGTAGVQAVAAGGFGGGAGLPGVAAGGFAGFPGVANGAFGGDASSMNEPLDDHERWAVTGAFSEREAPYFVAPKRRAQTAKGRRAKKRRR